MRVTVRIKRAKVCKICSPAQASAQEIGARPQATLLTLPPLSPQFSPPEKEAQGLVPIPCQREAS